MVTMAVRLYLLLAGASLAVAMFWQSILPAETKPEAMVMHYYRHVMGQLDGRSCPSYPVCSLYASQAIERYGFLLGSWLTIDRVIHEGDDLYQGQWLNIDGETRLYDPLSRNDFWMQIWIKGD